MAIYGRNNAFEGLKSVPREGSWEPRETKVRSVYVPSHGNWAKDSVQDFNEIKETREEKDASDLY